MDAAPHPGGRPSKYDPVYCEQIIALCREGYSITGFAGSIGVARSTINEWMEAHPEFSEAVKIAKAGAAYSLEKDATRVRQKGAGPGTATMIIFGLKNFAPEEYSDRQSHEISGPGGGPVEVRRIERVIIDPAADTDA